MTAWVSTTQQRSRLLRHLVDSSDPKEEQEAVLLHKQFNHTLKKTNLPT